MTTRILITDLQGNPRACLDGYHGARHAAEWTALVRAQLLAAGTETMAFELHPAEGGDAFRRDVLEQSGLVRVLLHTRPDGQSEVVGMACRSRHARGAFLPVSAHLRLLHAPADVHGTRGTIRIPRRELAAPPRDAAQQRTQRRAERAAARSRA